MKHSKSLTLAAARAHFREFWLPTLRPSDRPAVRLAWSQFIDALHRDRKISDKQAHSWDIPENFGRPRKATRKNPSAPWTVSSLGVRFRWADDVDRGHAPGYGGMEVQRRASGGGWLLSDRLDSPQAFARRGFSTKDAKDAGAPEWFTRAMVRANPSCGCRANPSKGRKPKRATKKPSRASAKPRRAKPITARKRR